LALGVDTGADADAGAEAPTMSAAGRGVGAESAEEEEAFFAIVVLYTLLCEVFLSIFRHYILYFILNMQ